jgi:NAD(P)-dependent dehydrogenase (short-subunit alcohol dehydrogenase family)
MVPAPLETAAVLLGVAAPEVGELASALGASDQLTCPEEPQDHGWTSAYGQVLDGWRSQIESLPETAALVVCTWTAAVAAVPLADIEPDAWRSRLEWPTALWFTTVVAAAGRCASGGSLVVVVERPATIDALGRAPQTAVADGMVNLVRSLAAVEGARGVRVNAVATQLQTPAVGLRGAAPALPSFPGTVAGEVAGAVRLLLSPDAIGVTGTTVAAGCGR